MTTIIFFVSLFAILAMLGSKIFEIKVREIVTVANFCKKGDAKIHRTVEKGIFLWNRYRKIARIFVFEFLPAYAYELSVKLKDRIAKKYYEMGDKFRGRRVLRDNGSVSAFLQRISEDTTDTQHHKV